jgi:hypothetical protein
MSTTYKVMDCDDVKLVDCAGCGRELLGDSIQFTEKSRLPLRYRFTPPVRGRFKGRPYCGMCRNNQLARLLEE